MISKGIAALAQDLVKRFGDFTAVDGMNFEVYQGEIFGFLGPNGSGKTTTIRMALGLLAPTSGRVEVLGVPVDGSTRSLRLRIGYMAQRFSLYNDLSVLQNLHFYGRAYGLSNQDLKTGVEDALMLAGLEGREKAKTGELSGGWRQRLALGAAILHQPEILFLDEPTAGVDPLSRRDFWDLLYGLIEKNITVFVTTHYMDEAEHCHRLAFIQSGSRIAYGSPAEIKQEVMPGKVLELAPSDTGKAIKILRETKDRLDIDEVELYGSLVHVTGPETKGQQEAIIKLLRSVDIDPGPTSLVEPSLEDVFIASIK